MSSNRTCPETNDSCKVVTCKEKKGGGYDLEILCEHNFINMGDQFSRRMVENKVDD